MKTLIVGYGNSTRKDDRAGILAAEDLERLGLPGVEVRTAQQLHVELVSDFYRYHRIIFIDASMSGPEIGLRKIKASSDDSMASSHHLGPELLLRLAAITRLGEPELYICSIRGESFDFGEELSAQAVHRVRLAVDQIQSMILLTKDHHPELRV